MGVGQSEGAGGKAGNQSAGGEIFGKQWEKRGKLTAENEEANYHDNRRKRSFTTHGGIKEVQITGTRPAIKKKSVLNACTKDKGRLSNSREG